MRIVVTEDVIIKQEEVHETVKESESKKDLELEFSILVTNYVPNNAEVDDKRKELGTFDYQTIKSIDGLKFVAESKNDDGDVYYGFV